MHITLSGDDHRTALDTVVPAIPTRSSLPILKQVRIDAAADGKVRYTATDLETTVIARLQAVEVKEPGTVCIPGKKLQEVTRHLPDQPVRFHPEGGQMRVSCGKSRFNFVTEDPSSWPDTPAIDVNRRFAMPGAALAALVRQSAFAASHEEARGVLQGVLWKLSKGAMEMVATDGHKLGHGKLAIDTAAAPAGEFVFRPESLELAAKLMGKAARVDVILEETRAAFAVPGVQIFCKLLEGKYPDYTIFFREKASHTVTADRSLLLGAFQRMGTMATDRTHRVAIDFASRKARLSVETADLGGSAEEMDIQMKGEGSMRIGFNAEYAEKVLSLLDAKEIEMGLSRPESPAYIRPTDTPADGVERTMIIMPLRLLAA